MKRVISKWFCLLCMAVLLVSISSCGNSAQKEEAARAAEQEQIRQNELQEAQRNYDEAKRKADEVKAWLENSIGEYEQLLRKQNNAETLNEWTEIEKQKKALEKQRDEKILEGDRYVAEMEIYQKKLNQQ